MPRLLDLFCGRFGWSRAFAARGWTCTCVDLVRPPEIPENCFFHQMDVLDLVDVVEYCQPDFICASSPCEQFSVHGMKHFHPNPPYPELGIRLFEHTRAICEASGVPYVMENVRAAQQFVGNAVHHCGPFYLWGSGVPPLMNQGVTKGTRMLPGGLRNKLLAAGADIKKHRHEVEQALNRKLGASCRRENIAGTATIPPELANCVADFAERLLEQRGEAVGAQEG